MIQPVLQIDAASRVQILRGVFSRLQPSPGERDGSQGLPANGWEKSLRKLAEFRELGDEWDGEGTYPPDAKLLDFAVSFVLAACAAGLDPPGTVTPDPAGGVVFVWQDPDGAYFEVEMDRPGCAEIMAIEPGRQPRHWNIPDSDEPLGP
jgi:hypothetical protein